MAQEVEDNISEGKKLSEDEKQQKLLKRTTVARGADTTLFSKMLANSKTPERTDQTHKSYEERLARLQAAFEARKKKHSEAAAQAAGETTSEKK